VIEIYNVLMVLLMIMQKMHGLRHRKLTSNKDAIRGGSNQTGNTERSIAAAGKSKRANTKRVGVHTGSSERSSADGSNYRMVGVDDGHTRRINADGVDSTMVGGANGEHSERSSANCMNHERVANGVNSQLNGISDGANCELNGTSDGLNSPLNGASDGGTSHGNIGSKRVRLDAPKRGRAKMSRTELKMAPRSGRVELAPRGHR